MTNSNQFNTKIYPWEEWSKLPKEERQAEAKEALKQNASQDERGAEAKPIPIGHFPNRADAHQHQSDVRGNNMIDTERIQHMDARQAQEEPSEVLAWTPANNSLNTPSARF